MNTYELNQIYRRVMQVTEVDPVFPPWHSLSIACMILVQAAYWQCLYAGTESSKRCMEFSVLADWLQQEQGYGSV